MKKIQKIRPPSKSEQVTATIANDYSDASSTLVSRRRSLLSYELELLDLRIGETRATLAKLAKDKQNLEARIDGLTRVLDKAIRHYFRR